MPKYFPFLTATVLLAFVPLAHAAAPVHVLLKTSATVSDAGNGFLTLGQIADLSGGSVPVRGRMAVISVCRAPLSGEARRLNAGDIALKLRQAGFDPDKDAVLEGAKQTSVTCEAVAASPDAANQTPVPPSVVSRGAPAPDPVPSPPSSPILIQRGGAVTILIQSGDLTITAKGIAREPGRAGDSIRVHRDGVMTDLNVTVLDAQTVQLEI